MVPWHPLGEELREILHVFGLIPALSGTVSEGAAQVSKAPAVAIVGEEGFVSGRSCNDGRTWEVGRPGAGGVESVESLLNRFQGSRYGGCSQIYHIRVGNELGHEVQLIYVEPAEALAQGECCFAAFVGELAWLALRCKVSRVLG